MNDCTFCERRQFDERIVAETNGFYIVATLGQITNGGYLLLFPEEHAPCMGACSGDENSSKVRLINKICQALTKEYSLRPESPFLPYPITLFEHGIVGQTVEHAHIHLLPTALDLTPTIKKDFPGCEIEELFDEDQLLKSYARRREPYLLWASGKRDGVLRACWNPPAPPQYFRTIIAELLGRPERANWRQMNPELDRELWSETVDRLEDYF